MLLKTERKKSDEKDYFAFYGAYYGAVAGGLLDKSIPQRINTRRTARFFCRSTAAYHGTISLSLPLRVRMISPIRDITLCSTFITDCAGYGGDKNEM